MKDKLYFGFWHIHYVLHVSIILVRAKLIFHPMNNNDVIIVSKRKIENVVTCSYRYEWRVETVVSDTGISL